MDEETFEKAAAFLPAVLGKMSSEDLLFFYARFKQAKEGANCRPKPGFFDFQGKQKWQAWKELGGMSREEARGQYVARMDELCPDWREKEAPEGGGMEAGWVCVSTMKNHEEDIADTDKTFLDFVKEGNLARVTVMLDSSKTLVSETDEEGMTALHWACDRGNSDIVGLLLSAGASVSATDGEKQTPLHFASSCGHAEVVQMLIDGGASVNVKDSDGLTPVDVAADEAVKAILV